MCLFSVFRANITTTCNTPTAGGDPSRPSTTGPLLHYPSCPKLAIVLLVLLPHKMDGPPADAAQDKDGHSPPAAAQEEDGPPAAQDEMALLLQPPKTKMAMTMLALLLLR